jgi:Tol biopolymer transport system component
VHRDLKPGNVMITKTGVKLLDFGLAKLAEHGGTAVADLATRTSPLTGQGSFIGTLHYMSPEQLEAGTVDGRSDMFSFGVVLYEMLTGRRAFDGTSQAGVIAAIVGGDTPPLSDLADTRTPLPPAARRALERLLRRCLEKDPDHRWHSAADLGAELQWISEERRSGSGQDEAVVATSAAPISRGRERTWMAATAVALLAAAGIAFWLWPRPAVPPESTTFTIAPPEKYDLNVGPGLMAISPDGRRLVFATGTGTDTQLWIRSMGSLTPQMLPGADGGWQPTWSPDGRFLLFAGGVGPSVPLKKLDVLGGSASTIAPAAFGRAAWGRGGVILFTGEDRRLYQLPEIGGQAKPASELDLSRQETDHMWPVFLPDGRRFVYCAQSSDPSKSALFLASLDSPGRTELVDVLSSVEYADGHLFYQRDGTLMAQRLDEKSGHLIGEAFPVMEDVDTNAINGRTAVTVSATGTLVVRRGGALNRLTTLTWFDESGKAVGTVGGPALNLVGARVSADHAHVVVPRSDGKQTDLWVIDTDRGVPTRITFEVGGAANPVWSPDGARVVFRSIRNGKVGLYQRAIAGGSKDELLFESADSKAATSFSTDGQILIFNRNMGADKGDDIWAMPMTGDKRPYAVLETPFVEQGGMLSPDGHWLAYWSNKSGSPQVYVQSFPTATQDVRISTTTGYWPAWGTDSGRLYYITSDFHVMAEAVTVSNGVLHPTVPKDLFVRTPAIGAHFFSIDPVGPRFLMPVSGDVAAQSVTPPLVVITNWTSTLKKQ